MYFPTATPVKMLHDAQNCTNTNQSNILPHLNNKVQFSWPSHSTCTIKLDSTSTMWWHIDIVLVLLNWIVQVLWDGHEN